MSMPITTRAAALITCLLLAPTIHAATIEHVVQFDTATFVKEGSLWQARDTHVPVTPFDIQAGDTLITTVEFLTGQSITFNEGNTPWGYGYELFQIQWQNLSYDSSNYGSNTSTYQVDWFTPGGTITTGGGSSYSNEPIQSVSNPLNSPSFTFTGLKLYSSVSTLNSTNGDYEFDNVIMRAMAAGEVVLNNAEQGTADAPAGYLLVILGLLGMFRHHQTRNRNAS